MKFRTPLAYRGMLLVFGVAAALGVAAVVTVGFTDRRDRGFSDHRSQVFQVPSAGVGMRYRFEGPESEAVGAEPGGVVTGDGTLPTGTRQPQSPTGTDRASGPAPIVTPASAVNAGSDDGIKQEPSGE